MLAAWPYVEADFQREYQIDLNAAMFAGMSWRRFAALLSGLSAKSVARDHVSNMPISDPSAAARELDMAFGLLGSGEAANES